MVSRIWSFNASCIGASHLKTGKVCQDFSLSWNTDNAAIITVADGHGSEAHLRSDRGARFAAEAALQCIKELLLVKQAAFSCPNTVLSALEKSIIAAWYEKIADDIRGEAADGNAFSLYGTSLYGTTLLAAAMTHNFWFAIQIGDGKCVVINEDNSISQPLPWDDRCFLNRTTSLCDEDAKNLFRHFYSEKLPLAIFLGSDGIDDSFPLNENEAHLARFYRSVYQNFLDEGLHKGETQFREILPLFTQKGSGDDVSTAGIIKKIAY
jgi:hypothetical protein